jgi:hypothetical protein
MSSGDHIREVELLGFRVTIDDRLGSICVAHDGAITWDALQAIKNEVWGTRARAIEIYPRQADVLDHGNLRHLWLLGDRDFCPDLLGPPADEVNSLQARYGRAWAEAS